MQWRLTAFKTVERDPGPGGLALAAAPGGLALARADAPPDAFCPVMRTAVVADLVELHCASLLIPLFRFIHRMARP